MSMPVNRQDQADTLLTSLFTHTWPGDTREDIDYPQVPDSGGSSEEWDGASEPSLPSVHFSKNGESGSEDESDTDNEEGENGIESAANSSMRYADNLYSSPLLSHFIEVEPN